MSALEAYAAHADLCAMIHPHEDVEMLIEMHDSDPELFAYPISGDALAVVKAGSPYQRSTRRQTAQAVRLQS